MELKRDDIISEIDTKLRYAKFINTDAVVLSNKAAQFCLDHIQFYEQKVKELTEENERLKKALNTDISIVRVSRGSGKTAHLREVGRIKVDAIRADTVRKMQERIRAEKFHHKNFGDLVYLADIDQTAKEMLEDSK